MAGIKITDLGILTSPVSEDLLYIVDVSDTSQSPQGTSKQIEVGNLVPIESGTWTPSISGISGAITNASIDIATYSKVGSIVTCAIYGTVNVNFSSFTSGEFTITLPVAGTDTYGIASISNPKHSTGACISNGTISLSSSDTSFIVTGTGFSAVFQYTAA
jgi:hypothetical protein